MTKFYYLLLIFFSAITFAWAQQPVSGTLLDDQGLPIPGANILNQRSKALTSTDLDGKFTIQASTGDKLLITSLGMKNQEINVSSTAPITITMKSDSSELEELVMIGYGSQKRSDVTGAIGTLKNEDFNQGLMTNPGQLLQGKVAGVNVSNTSGEPGASQDIVIRGVSSLRSGTTPLYVIDGFVIDNTSTGVPTNPMNFVNPSDIESIEVLKDASASAIYGARAANGVIVVTTKKGKSGRMQVNFSANQAISSIANKVDIFSANEFRKQVTAIGATLDEGGADTDWQNELTRAAISNNINFSVGGATEKTNYFASVGYEDQEGILKNSDLKRYTARVKLSQKALDDRFNVDFNLVSTRTENNRANASTIVSDMLSMNPTYAAYTDGKPTTIFNNGSFNPLIRQDIYSDVTNNNRIVANISPSYEIIKGLTYKLNLGVDYSSADRAVQNRPNEIPQEIGNLSLAYTTNKNSLVENTLTYNLLTEKHNFTALIGQSYQDIFYEARGWNYNGFPNNGIDPKYQIQAATELLSSYSDANKNELQSYFGRLNYAYNDKYLVTFTMRADGSSKFGKNNRYGYFPSVAAGWNLSKENFLSGVNAVSNLKLRASWGQTGNQEIPSKITQSSYQSSNEGNATYPLDGTGNYPVGVILVRTANPDLQWEVTTQTNIGLDFGFFQNRLTGSVDYFKKETKDILLEINPTDPITPTEKLWKNIPDMTIENTGLELALDYNGNFTKDFSFNVGGNITLIDNVVKKSPFKVLTSGEAQGPGTTNATINGYINNEPIGTFYVLDFQGINENGTNIFRDANNDGQITDDDRVAMGSAIPDFTYAFHIKFAYKNFDLGFNFNGVAGNMIYNNTASTLFTKGNLSLSHNTTNAAIQYDNESTNNTNVISSRYLEKGDYLRLNNATMGYNIKPKLIGLDNYLDNVRLSVTGQNLFLITKYNGFDPEVNTGLSTGGIQTYGIDYGTYPKARTISFGVNVAF
ncbi:MAG: SusC/RagA family TonB-linked outer membrane protein [Flavobacterium psychrophilum]|nr:MAG: SusC/RagA family TonB-linked outer membrane protein [Flavobacterium psychrophilum]